MIPRALLKGRHVLVTAGPTHEPIDPVRYIANRSSGKQGYAIARAAREAWGECDVGERSNPGLQRRKMLTLVKVETARQRCWRRPKKCCPLILPYVPLRSPTGEWRKRAGKRSRKTAQALPQLDLVENPDILKTISKQGPKRPNTGHRFCS